MTVRKVAKDHARSGRVSSARCEDCDWTSGPVRMGTLMPVESPGILARRHVARHGHRVGVETVEATFYVPT